MSVKLHTIHGAPGATADIPGESRVGSDFDLQVDALRAHVADRLLPHVGPIAWVLVDEALQPFAGHADIGRLSSPHIVSVLRRLHAALPHSIDRESVIGQLRHELLAGQT